MKLDGRSQEQPVLMPEPSNQGLGFRFDFGLGFRFRFGFGFSQCSEGLKVSGQ